ncbi:MAG TPA: cobalt-precorrin-6A reductase [Alphaproteobacteria bacterium]
MTTESARKRRLLILGGTTEARELAALASRHLAARLDVITSLAGRTEAPALPAGQVRRGGFGGAAGLAAFLGAEAIDYLVDATHPFARRISAHAVDAARRAGVPHLALIRPAWRRTAGDRWIDVSDAWAAAVLLPTLGRRVWLTVGSDDLAAFTSLPETWFLVRRIDPPSSPLPLRDVELILGRGPFSLADERRLLAEYRIEVLVCRASGGAATEAKLVAAREAGLPVIMIRRPAPVAGAVVETPEAALAWLLQRLDA